MATYMRPATRAFLYTTLLTCVRLVLTQTMAAIPVSEGRATSSHEPMLIDRVAWQEKKVNISLPLRIPCLVSISESGPPSGVVLMTRSDEAQWSTFGTWPELKILPWSARIQYESKYARVVG